MYGQAGTQVVYPQQTVVNPMVAYNQQLMNPYYSQQQQQKQIQTKDAANGIYDLRAKFPNGITLSWGVDAYVKTETGLIQKIKNKCGRGKKDEGQSGSSAAMDPRLAYYNQFYQQQQQQQQQNTNIKQILNKVNGIVKPGQLCAIMGASGAGKTTLLNILNFRNRGNLIIEDDIRVNGKVVKSGEIPEYSGYVQQLDLFIGTLTVREQLVLYAMLRMDRHVTNEQKYARVDEVVHQLNLYKCQDTRIGMGDLAKGISGGEKRRLAFAAEILNNPPLLFADEPTSGLDTFMALTVVDILVNLAKQGKTLICTIHQPSSQIFEKFDTLCLLSQGRVAYMGPRQDAYNFFSKLGYRCPNSYNPGDYYIQVLAIKPTTRQQSLEKSKRICDAYDRSEHNQKINSSIAQMNAQAINTPDTEFKRPWYNSSYLTQMRWLIWRETLNVLRNPIATYILLAQTTFIGVFLGLVYLQIKLNETGVQNYVGVLFLLVMQCNFGYIFSVVNSLPLELPILYREVKNRTYSVYTYYFSKSLADLPKYIISPFLLVTIVYWMSGIQNDASVFFRVASLLVLMTQVAIGFGLFLSIAAPNLDAALALSIPILIPLLIVGGFFLNNDSVPDFLIWLKYISWFYYTSDAIAIQFWPSIKSIPCTQSINATDVCVAQRCFKDGDDVLSSFLNINKSNFNLDIGILFVLLFVFRFGALVVLKLKTMAR